MDRQPCSLLRVWLGLIAALRLEVPVDSRVFGRSLSDCSDIIFSPFNPLFRALLFRKSLYRVVYIRNIRNIRKTGQLSWRPGMHLGMYVPDKWLTRDDMFNESKHDNENENEKMRKRENYSLEEARVSRPN